MYKLLKPILFLFDPEKVHCFVFTSLKITFKIPLLNNLLSNIYNFKNKQLKTKLFGLEFPNKVGLAAGFDKDAKLFNELAELGFGFIEIGTLTPKAQPGNEKPRLFRLPLDNALINRMGFNNGGVDEAVIRLTKKKNKNLIIGGNIGKNKVTENENAFLDYEYCFNTLFNAVDYFAINISSPNTPNLRALQEKEPLQKLLSSLQKLNLAKPKPKPILLKIAPDLADSQLDDIIEVVKLTGIAGVIATNTTIDRTSLKTDKIIVENIGTGGLSGKPVCKRSTEVIRYLVQKSNHAFPVIGVGGIHSPEDAIEKLKAGASLIQLYTGFIYEGPSLVKKINKAILNNINNEHNG